MAHSTSSKKRIRQTETRRLRNREDMSALRTLVKKFRLAVAAGDADKAQAEFNAAARTLDHAATCGLIHRNNASRRKSRLAHELRKLAQAKTA